MGEGWHGSEVDVDCGRMGTQTVGEWGDVDCGRMGEWGYGLWENGEGDEKYGGMRRGWRENDMCLVGNKGVVVRGKMWGCGQ
jgi:hypothetical protein